MIWSLALLALPAHADTPTSLAASYAHEAAGDYDAALAVLGTIPTDDVVLVMRAGWLQHLAGDDKHSAVSYGRAVALAPDAVEPRLGLTLPLMAELEWRDVLDTCDAVLAVAPGEPTAGARRAWAQYNLGQFQASATSYAALVAAYPSDLDLRNGLGWALCRDGDLVGASAAFSRVLSLDAANASATAGRETCQ